MLDIQREPTLIEAIRSRLRVMIALMIRELHTRFGRENLGYVWLFVEPAMLGVGVALWQWLMQGSSSMPGDLNKFSFFLIGYIMFYLFRTLVSRSTTGLAANFQLMFHSRVTIEAVMWARTVLDSAAVAVAILVFVVLIGLIFNDWPTDPLQMLLGVALMGLLSHGISLIFLSATAISPSLTDRLVHPFTYLSLPFSGMFYMAWWLPGDFQETLLLFPLLHIMEFVREGQFGGRVPCTYDPVFLMVWIIGLNFIGLVALKAAKPHLET
jgi:capsular polysaccharide transport system permease protein